MGLLIDTGIFIAMERGALPADAILGNIGNEPAFMSAVTTSELWHGYHRATSETRAEQRALFIEQASRLVPSLEIDDWVAREHARVWAQLESKGKMIGIHDSWIAATALVYDLSIATRNEREFRRVPGLRVEVW